MKVITFESPRGGTIHLTPAQVALLEQAERWPQDDAGFEYARVERGLHWGRPSFSNEQIAAFLMRGTPLEPRDDASDDMLETLH